MTTTILAILLLCSVSLSVYLGIQFLGLTAIKVILASNKFKTLVGLIAAIVMYFTPDEIDYCIITALGLLGIPTLVIDNYKKKDSKYEG